MWLGVARFGKAWRNRALSGRLINWQREDIGVDAFQDAANVVELHDARHLAKPRRRPHHFRNSSAAALNTSLTLRVASALAGAKVSRPEGFSTRRSSPRWTICRERWILPPGMSTKGIAEVGQEREVLPDRLGLLVEAAEREAAAAALQRGRERCAAERPALRRVRLEVVLSPH